MREPPTLRTAAALFLAATALLACLALLLMIGTYVASPRAGPSSAFPRSAALQPGEPSRAFETVLAAQRHSAQDRLQQRGLINYHSKDVVTKHHLTDTRFQQWRKERGPLKIGDFRKSARDSAQMEHLHPGGTYSPGQTIGVFAKKVGPIAAGGPEGVGVKDFFHLPWFNCGEPFLKEKDDEGSPLLFGVPYMGHRGKSVVVRCKLDGDQVTRLYDAIKDHWFAELEFDGLPVFSFVGINLPDGGVAVFKNIIWKTDLNPEEKAVVYAHVLTFDHSGMQKLTRGQPAEIEYTAAAEWENGGYSRKDRALRVAKNDLFDQLNVDVDFET